jgi:hypothetical protein
MTTATQHSEATYRDHEFEEDGSLASECERCGLAFALATSHGNWSGKLCLPRASHQKAAIHQEWLQYTSAP